MPNDIDEKIIELSDVKILHFSDVTIKSEKLKKITEESKIKVHKLRAGEALVFADMSSEGLSKNFYVKIRPRITKHGAPTKTSLKGK